MTNTSTRISMIIISLYFIYQTEASPTQIVQKPLDPSRCLPYEEDLNLPDETDCTKYFRCVYGKKVPKICPDKMLFNPEKSNCDFYYNVDCPSMKIPDEAENKDEITDDIDDFINTTKTRTHDTQNKLATVSENETTKFVYMTHENNASEYYKFENGKKMLMVCEEGMVFSIDLEICA